MYIFWTEIIVIKYVSSYFILHGYDKHNRRLLSTNPIRSTNSF